VTDKFAVYNSDCIEVMQSMPAGCVHLSIYSPPFGGLYHYSSNERDLSNCDDYGQFFEHYEHVVREKHRITMPGRVSAVHCMDVPRSNSGTDSAARTARLALHRPAHDLERTARGSTAHHAEEPGARVTRG
jgi:hypothetical protein